MTSVSLRCAKAYINAVETFRGPDQRQIRFVCTFFEGPLYIKVYKGYQNATPRWRGFKPHAHPPLARFQTSCSPPAGEVSNLASKGCCVSYRRRRLFRWWGFLAFASISSTGSGTIRGRVRIQKMSAIPITKAAILKSCAADIHPRTRGVIRQNSAINRSTPKATRLAPNSAPGVASNLRRCDQRIPKNVNAISVSYIGVGWTGTSVGTVPLGNAIAQGRSDGGP